MFVIICRLDETLKTMESESMSKSPVHLERKVGRQSLRDLVNPNIKQSAPEVSRFYCYYSYKLNGGHQ